MPCRIELIGVYRLPVTEELTIAQAEVLSGESPSTVDQRWQTAGC